MNPASDAIVAVTGAAGFLGARIVARLAADGLAVRALTRGPGDRARAAGAAEVIGWALGSPAPLDGVRVVVHAAAHRPARYTDPAEAGDCFALNAVATSKLVEDAVAAGVEAVVYVSAGNVYRPSARPATEDDPIRPSSRAPYYLVSKVAGEMVVAAAGDAGRIRAVSLRPSAIYGPGMPPGLVPTLVDRIRSGGVATIADGGRYHADLVYVDDVADAVAVAARLPVRGAYNLGGGEVVSALALARRIAALCGRGADAIAVEPESPGAAPGFVALDVTRARRDLAFAPRPLDDGLRAMIHGGGAR